MLNGTLDEQADDIWTVAELGSAALESEEDLRQSA